MFNNNLLMGAAAATSGEPLIEISNSALLSGSTQSLTDTPASAGDLRDWTFSYWIYYNDDTSSKIIFATGSSPYGNFASYAGSFSMQSHNSTGANHNFIIPDRKFRDSAWYHFVIRCSSTSGDGTAVYDNMNVSIWVNGEPQPVTSVPINTPTGGPQLFDGGVQTIGNSSSSPNYYIAEMVYLDGQKQTADAFGQYDSTYKFWTPKSPDVIKELTFGTNGFYFDNATNPQTDASGNGNNYTNNNSVTTSTHTPTQLWPIFSSLSAGFSSGVSDGNTGVTYGDAGANYSIISFPGTGKFVAQCTADDVVSNGIGWVALNADGGVSTSNALVLNEARWIGLTGGNWIHSQYVNFVGGTNLGTVKTSASDGDILQLEWDNGTLTVQINGTRYTPSNWTAVDTSLNWAFLSRCAGNGTETWDFGQDGFTPHDTSYSYVNTTTLASDITRTKSNLEKYFDTTLYEGNGAGQRVGKFLPFTDTFTVGNSGLFKLISSSQNTSNARLTRTQAAGATTKKFCFSFWFKRGKISGTNQYIYSDAPTDGYYSGIYINTSNQVEIFCFTSSGTMYKAAITRVIKDTSQWNHVVINIDTSQATAADRQEMYLNGVDQPLTITNQISQDNTSFTIGDADIPIGIGSFISNSSPRLPFDGYLAEYVYINNVNLAASNFGQVDTSTGRWIPKSLSGLSFDSTGFYLNFATLGDDVSGNNNDFTNANVVQSSDTPTVNFTTFDPNRASASATATIGNTRATVANSQAEIMLTTIPFDGTGKFYAEIHCVTGFNDGGGSGGMVGFADPKTIALSSSTRAYNQTNEAGMGYYYFDGKKYINGTGSAYGSTFTNSDVIGVYVNGNNIYFTKNNTLQNSASEAEVVAGTPTNAFYTDIGGYCLSILGAGGNNPVADIKVSSDDWTHTPFTGFGELSQDNLTTGESYQTAFSWIKNRDATDNHMLFDRVRGIYNDLHSNTSDTEVTNVNTLQRFLNGGVQVGNDVQVNTASESYVAWNWYMQTTGSGTSNTDGTINTTATLVDTNLGLSISEFTGTGANATIGHGLGVVPQMYWVKGIDAGDHWYVYHANNTAAPETDALLLNGNSGGFDDATLWNDTAPTSSLISLGSNSSVNGSSQKFLAMAFAPSQFTSIGGYIGNGNAIGAFVPTVNSLGISIQPAWVLIKRTGTANNWCIRDTVRDIDNPNEKELDADLSNAEITNSDLDIGTGGFKLRANDNIFNASDGTYVYLAFGTPMIDVDGRIITGF